MDKEQKKRLEEYILRHRENCAGMNPECDQCFQYALIDEQAAEVERLKENMTEVASNYWKKCEENQRLRETLRDIEKNHDGYGTYSGTQCQEIAKAALEGKDG